MLIINSFPNNEKHFLELLKFYNELAEYFNEIDIKPIVWGSLMYFVYTQDENYDIHDIDLLLPLKNISELRKRLEDNSNYTTKFIDEWNILQVFKDELLIEFDPLEKYITNNSAEFQKVNLHNIELIGISKKSLEKLYLNASQISNDKPEKHKMKYEKLREIN